MKQQLNLRAGVLVTEVRQDGFFDHLGIPSGTIIAFVNGKAVASPKDVEAALLSAQSGMVQMLAIAPDGSRVVFNFPLGT
ncbi:S1C family serine protease [Hymenobacter volaticus]|uniref:S1C family serine protease n=1 Tax=Hymenobacter volaticus TaxID=2932254 RepID=A0ABY4GDK7_9BACT|nr:S1C family serine protease [Hymenobacter volaticus]UOQ68876.1 S1C family serine protease [Hymenobacter volaticus]